MPIKNIGQLMDASGNIVAKYEYSPFGKVTAQSGSYAEANPFRFSSEYADGETGLVYYNYRYYSSILGRWLSRDPFEEERGGYDLYSFCLSKNINEFDRLGLSIFKIIRIIFNPISTADGYDIYVTKLHSSSVECVLWTIPCLCGQYAKICRYRVFVYASADQRFGQPLHKGRFSSRFSLMVLESEQCPEYKQERMDY